MNSQLTIRDVIQRSATRNPEAQALLAPGRRAMTYASLATLVDDSALALRRAGIRRGDRVAIVLPNGPEAAAVFCAVASAAVCAPLNPAYSRDEFEFFLGDLRASALVTDDPAGSAAAAARKLHVPVLRAVAADSGAAGDFAFAAGVRPAGPLEVAQAGDAALMLHTSGTTSRPKLVPLTQANLCVSAANIVRTLDLSPADRCLNVMPLFHIHGLMAAVLASLTAGGSIVCTPGFHAARFFDWLSEFDPTWYTAVPTMHQALLARAETQAWAEVKSRLRLIRSSSASLAPKVMADLEALFHAPVVEAYGMTEASHQMASNPLPPAVRKPGSVGLAAGPEIAVMGGTGDLLAEGQTGEIVIRGANVTAGYEAGPEVNLSAFRNGWFRTGDQGYLDSDGYLFLTGRLKEIINRGGEKISPREVDEVILLHPAVRQALTFAVPHVQLGEDVGAVIVLKAGAAGHADEIREFAAARLAVFKVPRLVRFVEEIPKGPTGKLQRIGLAAKLGIEPIDDVRAGPRGIRTPPRDAMERQLAAAWREVLAVDDVAIEDNFASLGGTSLQLAQLLARAETLAGIRLSMAGFLENPTVAGMAEAARRADSGRQLAVADGVVSIQPEGSAPPLFCMPGHDGLMTGFAHLARWIGPDQPVLGVQIPDAGPGTRLEDMAGAAVEAIRRQQPEGPYHLLGLCFGGRLAYEAACRLEESGETVALLSLVNCLNRRDRFRRRSASDFADALGRLAKGVAHHWRELTSREPREWFAYLRQRMEKFLGDDVALWLPRIRRAVGAPVRTNDQLRLRQIAGDRWRARPYGGNVILIASGVPRLGVYPSRQLGFEGLIASQAPFQPLPSSNTRLWVDANLAFLASGLGACLPGKAASPVRIPGAGQE